MAPGGGFEPIPTVISKTTVLPLDDPGTLFVFMAKHTFPIYARYRADIVTNWPASKASNLEFPRSERGVLPVTLLATNLGCAGGIRTRIALINSQVLCH